MQRTVRIGRVADQDGFRRDDASAVSPGDRLMHRVRMRDQQFGDVALRTRDTGRVSYRTIPAAEVPHATQPSDYVFPLHGYTLFQYLAHQRVSW